MNVLFHGDWKSQSFPDRRYEYQRAGITTGTVYITTCISCPMNVVQSNLMKSIGTHRVGVRVTLTPKK